MYVITNRAVDETKSGLEVFGKDPNPKGPNELRIVEVKAEGAGAFRTTVLDDELSKDEVRRLKQKYRLKIDTRQTWYVSLRVACELYDRACEENKDILVVNHGYNNNMADVLEMCEQLEATYDCIVLPFSWPANGGGVLTGMAAYLADKRDARASADALNRVVDHIGYLHSLMIEGHRQAIEEKVEKHFAGRRNLQAETAMKTQLMNDMCKTRISFMCHSMGNYVLEWAVRQQGPHQGTRSLVFDNIILMAADANNPGHREWVRHLPVRRRLYVVINEDDYALQWSRRKPGEEQLERLGHYLRNLSAENAYYVNLTGVQAVGNTHTYFIREPVENDAELKGMFGRMFAGEAVEDVLRYHDDRNFYTPAV